MRKFKATLTASYFTSTSDHNVLGPAWLLARRDFDGWQDSGSGNEKAIKIYIFRFLEGILQHQQVPIDVHKIGFLVSDDTCPTPRDYDSYTSTHFIALTFLQTTEISNVMVE